jgi:hypothetical protein
MAKHFIGILRGLTSTARRGVAHKGTEAKAVKQIWVHTDLWLSWRTQSKKETVKGKDQSFAGV